MVKRCTCGAELPPDASFCHKCGKPQFELPVVAEPPWPPEPEALEPAKGPVAINFHNRAAVRVGLLAAAIASLLISFPMPTLVNLIWMFVSFVGAGFFAVYLYNRRTGDQLTLRGGARLGWITGVFCFVIATIFFTIVVISVSLGEGLTEFYRKQLKSQAAGVDVKEFLHVLQSPAGLAAILLFSLLVLFVFSTVLPLIGGAMGAKVLEKD